jgi:glycosyltransferase involved in cell wall biosynthesis
MRFSLIVPTVDRVNELRQLLQSLASQECANFEVIVVDQNADDRLVWIEQENYPFQVLRLSSSVAHSSTARNIGLRRALGDIVAFPDDDCTYPPGLLARLSQAFYDDHRFEIRTGPAVAPAGFLSSMRWQRSSGEISIRNVWHTAIEFNMFIRRSLITGLEGFDEQLGAGGKFGSGEGTDLIVRALSAGARGWYDVTQTVFHPEKKLTVTAAERAFGYGAGCGYVLRKQRFPPGISLTFMVRPLGGLILSVARGQVLPAKYYWRTLHGRLYGFNAYRHSKNSE